MTDMADKEANSRRFQMRDSSDRKVSESDSIARNVFSAMVVGCVLAMIPFFLDHRAYFHDDMQAQYMPTFYLIGSALRELEGWPLFTLQSMRGGNLLAEYQYAVLNPVTLFLYGVLPSFDSLATGAAFLGVAYTGIMSGGAYLVAHNLGISKSYAWVAVIAVATNTFIFYWLASSWFPGLSSIAFLLWFMGCATSRGLGRLSFLGTGVAAALTVTSGWPQTAIVMIIFAVLVVGQHIRRGNRANAVGLLLATAIGVAISLPAVIPLVSLGDVAARQSGLWNNGFLVPSLGDVLSFSNPMHQGRMLAFQGYKTITAPTYYAAWFILPLLVLIEWRKVDWQQPALRLLLSFVIVLLLLTQGPEQMGPLRWPFRFLPYLQITLVMLALLLLSQAGLAAWSLQRIAVLLLAITGSALLSVQTSPWNVWPILLFTAVIALGGVILARLDVQRNRALMLNCISLLLVILTHLVIARNTEVADWNLPGTKLHPAPFFEVPASYDFIASESGDVRDQDRFDEITFGQMGLAEGRSLINGYSPLEPRGLKVLFCFKTHGFTCPEAGSGLMQTDPNTGATFADLMRVGRIVAARGPHLDALQASLRAPWTIAEEKKRTVVFSRPLPSRALPGLMSWPVEGLTVELAAPTSPESETLLIKSRRSEINTVVFARMWWPGYRAWFNGDEIPVRPISGLLVAVDLPHDGSTGLLHVRYSPPGFLTSVMLSFISILGFLMLAWSYNIWHPWLFRMLHAQNSSTSTSG